MARLLGIVLAAFLIVGAFPVGSVHAQVACAPATPGAVGSASTFTLPQHTLASIRWSTYSAEIVFRVPLGVQATVYGGLGSYWVYDPASCTEAEVDRQARDHAARIGTAVTNIYSIPSYLLQVGGGIGYQPPPYTPPPYAPPPTQPAPPYTPPPYMPPYYPIPPSRPVIGPSCPQVGGLQTAPAVHIYGVCTYPRLGSTDGRANVTVPGGIALRWRYYIDVQTWWWPFTTYKQEVTAFAYSGQTVLTDWFEVYSWP